MQQIKKCKISIINVGLKKLYPKLFLSYRCGVMCATKLNIQIKLPLSWTGWLSVAG